MTHADIIAARAIPKYQPSPGLPNVVPADDRADLDSPMAPGRPGSLADLLAIWRDRDVQYAQSDRALTDEQVRSIRAGRTREVNDLPPAQRAKAWGIAKSWFPPQHGQGTGSDKPEGLRAWL
jgi:hypothetical protein